MNGVFALVLSMSVAGSVLAAGVLLADKIGRKKTTRRWQYYIWLVVIVRLLIPFGPEMTVVSRTFDAIPGQYGVVSAKAPQTDENASVQTASLPAAAYPLAASQSPAQQGGEKAAADKTEEEENPFKWLEYIWIVWVIGAVALFIRKITVYQSFQRYVRAGTEPCDDIELLDSLALAGEKCGVRRPVELGVNPLVSSPLLTGLIRPCIVIPSEDISHEDFRYVAMHELTHLKRLDIIYKWAVQTAVCVHWFNPLVHWIAKRISRLCEFACDEAVVAKTGPDGAVPYGRTLLNAMAQSGPYNEPLGSVSLSENKKILKERLQAMKTYGRKISGSALVAAVLTGCLIFAAGCTGVYRAGLPRRVPAGASREETVSVPASTEGFALELKEAAVKLQCTEEDKIRAEYDENLFDVEIREESDTTQVKCRGRASSDGEVITLYVPRQAYQDISIAADGSFLRWEDLPSGNVAGAFNDSFAAIGLPDDFEGALTVTSANGYTEVISDSDYAGMDVTLYGAYISAPEYFVQSGDSFTYSDGKAAIINISESAGLLRIADSDTTSIGDIADEWEDYRAHGGSPKGALRSAIAAAAEIAKENGGAWTEAFKSGFLEAFSSALPEVPQSSATPEAEPSASAAASASASPEPSRSAGRDRTASEQSARSESIEDGLGDIAREIGGFLGDLSSVISEELDGALDDVRDGLHEGRERIRN